MTEPVLVPTVRSPLIVMFPVPAVPLPKVLGPVVLKTTLLKVRRPLGVRVAVEPSKVTVPPLALKIGEPETDKAPAIVKLVAEGAVNVPPVRVTLPLKSRVPALALKTPPDWLNAPST